ncbi:hypothetical protein ACWKWU_20705 [Chitinophaga lutea]
MNERRNIQSEVERTLRSLDGVARAEAPDFFYSRLRARMQQVRPADAWERLIVLITRPSVAIAAILVVLALNGSMFLSRYNAGGERGEKLALQQAFADEYQLGLTTFYDYDKTEQ